MLKEIAFTPQVFDQACNPDVDAWLESLCALGQDLFPRGAALMVASNLWDGAWIDVVRKKLGGISDHRARDRVQLLITKLRKIVVRRPHVNEEWPDDDDEDAWASEAVASHRLEPIERIVLTDGLFDRKRHPAAPCHGLLSVKEDSFWSGIQASAQVPMRIDAQVENLRPICLHAEYLALKLPHAHGAIDDETPFAAAVLELAFRRREGFARVHAELHVLGENRGHVLEPAARENVAKNIKCVLGERLPAGSEVLLCMWPHFIDRKLVAGRLTTSGGRVLPSQKWGIAFNHVARPGSEKKPPTTWSLIATNDLTSFSRDVDANSSAVLYQEILRF